jgi:hypothetical protein
MFTEVETLQLDRIYKDASHKVAELPAREKAEFLKAEQQHRKPYPITPLTAIPAPLLEKVLDAITGEIPADVRPLIGPLRKATRGCETGADANLLSAQLKAVLDAAGLTPKEA